MSNEHKYRLTYNVTPHPDGITTEEIKKNFDGSGACDAILCMSMIYPPDGSFSCATITLDGRTDKPLNDVEIFKVWMLLAHQLAESATLDTGRKSLCNNVFEIIRDGIMENRNKEETQ